MPTEPDKPASFEGARVLVTGAGGFIGSAVARQLAARGAEVVAGVLPGTSHEVSPSSAARLVEADLRDAAAITRAMEGCRYVFHVAALYRFYAPNPDDFYEINVGGTLNVLEAARLCGVERVVYTSTVGTIGLDHTSGPSSRPASESDWARVEHLFGYYKRSKYVAEHEVLRAAAEGLPVVLVQPTMPVGPGDRAPTPTGKTILDYLNGRMRAYIDTAMNVVDVDDVAAGHLLAATCGKIGRSYVLGGENLSFRQVLEALSEVTGLPCPRLRVPTTAAVVAGALSELVERRLMHRQPSVPLEGARMSQTKMVFTDERARSELGYSSRPASQALERSARFYVENGYVSPRRVSMISWQR